MVSGCFSELESEQALAELGIDLVVPNSDKDNLVALASAAFAHYGMPESATLPAESALFARNRHRAFIKIQDGCRYRCTFCIVTVARGSERSRTIVDLVNEVQQLHNNGVREIVLTGVHVGGYGSDLDTNLEALVNALLSDTDMPRIRFASVEPWDLSAGFLDLFANPRVQPHMHLPLQSGSDTVLRRMARRCKTSDYADLTEALRTAVPHFNITTDIIAGFPGESEDEWQRSMEFIASQRFGHIHAFTYSEREGTKAASMDEQVPMPIRQKRSGELHVLAESMKLAQLEQSVGTVANVLWERGKQLDVASDTPMFEFQGYTPNYQRAVIRSDKALSNEIMPVMIKSVENGKLMADLINDDKVCLPGTASRAS